MIYVVAIVGVVVLLVVVRYVVALGSVHACARTGRVDRLRRLLEKNPELIKAQNGDGETPVHQAAKYGELEALRFLLARGGDVRAKSKQGVTPLHLAAAFGEAQNHLEVVEVLKSAGANPDAMPAFADFGGGHFLAPIASDDPLMRLATKKARDALPTLRELFKEHPRDTMVKLAFVTDAGETEHLSAELIALDGDRFKARIKTPPVTHTGKLAKVQERSLNDLEDWQVELRDGRIRGGYGFQVVFHRIKEKLGQLPPELAPQEARFIDHDVSALLREAGDTTH
jgi:hypothetical protein